jgi:hypothetical protein
MPGLVNSLFNREHVRQRQLGWLGVKAQRVNIDSPLL